MALYGQESFSSLNWGFQRAAALVHRHNGAEISSLLRGHQAFLQQAAVLTCSSHQAQADGSLLKGQREHQFWTTGQSCNRIQAEAARNRVGGEAVHPKLPYPWSNAGCDGHTQPGITQGLVQHCCEETTLRQRPWMS